jgi:anti-anti-sigma regulatory factor
MLRITTIRDDGSPVQLKLEGKIMAEWASLLEQECRAHIAQRRQVVLDMAGVTFLDGQGVTMLRNLPCRYVSLMNRSDFVTELLDKGEQP